jgi:hypothetical protein
MKKINIYKYIFYILYKFIKLTTKKEFQNEVPNATCTLYLICLTQNYATVLIFTKAIQFFPANVLATITLFSIVPITIYFINQNLFIKDDKYVVIENYYDEKNRLGKKSFIGISVAYCLLSIGLMILAGINYTRI